MKYPELLLRDISRSLVAVFAMAAWPGPMMVTCQRNRRGIQCPIQIRGSKRRCDPGLSPHRTAVFTTEYRAGGSPDLDCTDRSLPRWKITGTNASRPSHDCRPARGLKAARGGENDMIGSRARQRAQGPVMPKPGAIGAFALTNGRSSSRPRKISEQQRQMCGAEPTPRGVRQQFKNAAGHPATRCEHRVLCCPV